MISPQPSFLFQLLYDRYGPQHWWPARTMTGMMVGAVLVQNTAWTQAAKAVDQLESRGLLDFAAICKAPDELLWEIIRPAGYFRVKTRRLKALAAFLASHANLAEIIHPGNDRLRQELLAVYGIGKETADSILCYAAKQPVFVVDAYTKRLFLRLGWIETGKESYDIMQQIVHGAMAADVESLGEFHALIVRHAKEHCLKRPQCQGCPIVICPLGDIHHFNRET
ncbi:MAG: DNA repair protein, HhH-GPD family [Magnetococcales bacterium]|nr:DNA repair protein, HhH-GPD family [Magnetococcales bacterium]